MVDARKLTYDPKGVILHLKSAAQGIALDLGVEGLKVTME
jgi:hypothetical protein